MSYRELLKDIRTARETGEPLEAVSLRRYMAEKSPQTRALVVAFFTDNAVWDLAKNIPSPERNVYLLQELMAALSRTDSRRAFSQGHALMTITEMLLRLCSEVARSKKPTASAESETMARALIGVLEDAARSGDEELRSLMVTAVLEHVLPYNDIALGLFQHWSRDSLLRPLLDEGMTLSGIRE